MGSELQQSLVRVAPFAVGVLILGLLVAVRPDARERLAWKPVPARVLVRWLLLWVVWVAATELLAGALGRPPPARFTAHGAALAVRIVGIVGLAPLLEELVFRGILFRLLLPRAGPGATVVGTALLFALARTGSTARSTWCRSWPTGSCSAWPASGPARRASRSGCTSSGTRSRSGSVSGPGESAARGSEVRRAQPPGRLVERRVRLAEGEPRHAGRP